MGGCWSRTTEELEATRMSALGTNFGFGNEYDCIDSLLIQQKAVNQQHLFNSFTPEKMTLQKKKDYQKEIKQYMKQLDSIDYQLVNELYETLYKNPSPPLKVENLDRVNQQFSLLDGQTEEQKHESVSKQEELFSSGLLAVAQGKIAVVIMAGGQASRLGADVPKGAYQLEIPDYEEPSLFHIFASKLEALERHARNTLPQQCKNSQDLLQLYIMTSSSTDQDTKDYFSKHHNFGLSKSQVNYFMQGDLPAVDNQGKIILKDEFEVFMAPNGNGGLYDGIETVLPKMREQGIEYIHIVGVDNILNKLADPIMIGYSIENNIDFISKFVKKTNPDEKVGIHVELNQKLSMIEYSELSEEQRHAKQQNGDLKFNQGFLAQFMIKRSLMEELIKTKDPKKRRERLLQAKKKALDAGLTESQVYEKLGPELQEAEKHSEEIQENKKEGWGAYHLAKKNIEPLFDQEQGIVLEKNPEPKENGMKFEQFIFDPFTEIQSYTLQEVLREDEFAPIKNRDYDPKTNKQIASDNRITAKELQSQLHMRWLKAAGFKFQDGLVPDGKDNVVFVDPRLSYFGEGLMDGSKHPVITKLPFVLKCNLPKKKTSDSFMGSILSK